MPSYSFYNLFNSCTKLTAGPTLPATSLGNDCYNSMFSTCTSLTSIRLGWTGNLGSTYFSNWVNNITTTGTLYYSGSDNSTGANARPANWTKAPY